MYDQYLAMQMAGMQLPMKNHLTTNTLGTVSLREYVQAMANRELLNAQTPSEEEEEKLLRNMQRKYLREDLKRELPPQKNYYSKLLLLLEETL